MSIEDRLNVLESANRFYRRIIAFTSVALLCAIATGAAAVADKDSLVTRRVILTDDAGKKVAILNGESYGCSISTPDGKDGLVAFKLSAKETSLYVTHDGTYSGSISAAEKSANLHLFDHKTETVRVNLAATAPEPNKNSAAIAIMDRFGKIEWSANAK